MKRKKAVAALIIAVLYLNMSGCLTKPEKEKDTGNIPKASEVAARNKDNMISQEKAFDKLSKLVGTIPKGFHLDFDHILMKDSKEYYVFHFYEFVTDDEKTGVGHTVTYEWYYVDKSNGDIYKLDIITDNLIKADRNN